MRRAAFGVVDRLAGRIGWRAVLLAARIPGRPVASGTCAGCGVTSRLLKDDVSLWRRSCGGAGDVSKPALTLTRPQSPPHDSIGFRVALTTSRLHRCSFNLDRRP
jgi:hypothetical protein